jgi:hypothetical protein
MKCLTSFDVCVCVYIYIYIYIYVYIYICVCVCVSVCVCVCRTARRYPPRRIPVRSFKLVNGQYSCPTRLVWFLKYIFVTMIRT